MYASFFFSIRSGSLSLCVCCFLILLSIYLFIYLICSWSWSCCFQIVHNDAEWFHWTVGLMQLHCCYCYCWIQIMLKTKCRQIKCSHRPLLSLSSYVNIVEFKFNRFVAETSVYLFIFFLYIFCTCYLSIRRFFLLFIHMGSLSVHRNRPIYSIFVCVHPILEL